MDDRVMDYSAPPQPAQGWFKQVAAPGLAVLKRLWVPFVLIQCMGLSVVVLYFSWQPFREACDAIGRFKLATGPLFAMLVMPVAAGVVPELFKALTGIDRSFNAKRVKHVLYAMVVFSLGGLYVDTFYTLLNRYLGDSPTIFNVTSKVLIDQFLYTTTIGIPWMALAFNFESVGFSLGKLWQSLRSNWYMREVAPLLVVCWAYWFPMTSLMYVLPASLTFVFGACASAASAILLVAVARRHHSS
jgi:hypothetical protein